MIVKQLIENGASINAVNKLNKSALNVALENGKCCELSCLATLQAINDLTFLSNLYSTRI